VSVVTSLRAGRSDFDSRQGQGIFSLRHRFQIGSEAHLASNPLGIMGSFPEGKAAGA
jgi:hypothetical protein